MAGLDDIKDTLERLPKIIAFFVGLILVVYALMLVADVLFLHYMYNKTFQALSANVGLSVPIAKSISVLAAAVYYVVVPMMVTSFLFMRRFKAAMLVVCAFGGWFLLIGLIAQPPAGQFFNPVTGEPLYKYYKGTDGRIQLFPREYTCHPTLGCSVQLLDITPNIADEYLNQNPSGNAGGVSDLSSQERSIRYQPYNWFAVTNEPSQVVSSFVAGRSDGEGIALWVTQVGVNNDFTTVRINYRAVGDCKSLYPASENRQRVFLSDEYGSVYNLVDDLTGYNYVTDNLGHRQDHHNTVCDQLDSSDLVFARIRDDATRLTFHHWQFPPIEVRLQRGGSLPPAQAPPTTYDPSVAPRYLPRFSSDGSPTVSAAPYAPRYLPDRLVQAQQNAGYQKDAGIGTDNSTVNVERTPRKTLAQRMDELGIKRSVGDPRGDRAVMSTEVGDNLSLQQEIDDLARRLANDPPKDEAAKRLLENYLDQLKSKVSR